MKYFGKISRILFIRVIFCSFLSLLFVLVFACHSGKKQDEKSQVYECGKVIEKVLCTKSKSQNYALYLPSAYRQDKSWPVIYFFDSRARGSLPVVKYKRLAEKFGYILAGSNNSQNQQSWDNTRYYAQMFFEDVSGKFNIDNKRIYTSGFSGGARVASSLAIMNGGIAGVIGCAAGFPQTEVIQKNLFYYIGIVGNEDFNYLEMNDLDSYLDKSALKHQLIIFDGKHDWPPENIMEEAFLWLLVNAAKEKRATLNDSLIAESFKSLESQIGAAAKGNDPLTLYQVLKKTENFYDGLEDVSAYRKKLDELQKSTGYLKYRKSESEIRRQEYSKQQEFLKSFNNKSFNWWKNEIEGLNKLEKSKDHKISLMARRLKSYISLGSYMNTSGALKAGDKAATEHYLQIYRMIDPWNVDFHYLTACFYARQNNTQEALKSLHTAIELGFNDATKAREDVNLKSLQNIEEFELLLKKMK